MKKIFTLTLFIVSVGLVKEAAAQIPNNQFETWVNTGTYDSLVGWNTDNFLAPTCSQATTTTPQSGTTSLKLVTSSYVSSPFTLSLPGAASTGGFNVSGTSINLATGGQPDAARHAFLKGYYKYAPVLGALGSIETVLYKYNSGTGNRDTIASAIMSLSSASNYTFFILPLVYLSSSNPDSSIVFFQSSGRALGDLFNTGTLGSALYIDSVYFDGITGVDDIDQNLISVISYPNPTADMLIIEAKWKSPLNGSIGIFDVHGKLIQTIPGLHDKQEIDVHSLSNGNYFYYLLDETGRKLNSGKFFVNK